MQITFHSPVVCAQILLHQETQLLETIKSSLQSMYEPFQGLYTASQRTRGWGVRKQSRAGSCPSVAP